MFCKNCGTESILAEPRFCRVCGTKAVLKSGSLVCTSCSAGLNEVNHETKTWHEEKAIQRSYTARC